MIDTLFGPEDFNENQLDVLHHQLDQYQEKLDMLKGIDGPEAAKEREDTVTAMHQVQINIEQTREAQAEKAQQEEIGKARGFSSFND
ncbi:MAG: hypothetical protein OEY94_09005 [Alphaproteobacteria bacterium]|nr:hypothetical protein [Alphaproteobacteria bacterium]